MERTLKIKLWKDMIKGNIDSIAAKEPEFGYVTRSVRFDKHEHGIKVTIEDVFDEVKNVKEMVLNFGEAWCFFEQAVWRAETVNVCVNGNNIVYVKVTEDEQ